jgi:RNA polymerase sigma-70 factor (ECF subfamily)
MAPSIGKGLSPFILFSDVVGKTGSLPSFNRRGWKLANGIELRPNLQETDLSDVNSTPQDVTQLLIELTKGNNEATSKLIPLVYKELHRLARRQMRGERSDHTLQATALVNEAYLRLVENRPVRWQNRAHFFAVAAQMMRRILIDHARSHLREKRGGGQKTLALDEGLVFGPEQSMELVQLDRSLSRLAEIDPRQSKIVEMRFFAGLTVEETAEVLQISPKTVKREWSIAKAWLHGDLRR